MSDNIYYKEVGYLPVGRLCWKFELNVAAKCITAAIILALAGSIPLRLTTEIISHSEPTGIITASIIKIVRGVAWLSLYSAAVPGTAALAATIVVKRPVFGKLQHNYYKTELTLKENGVTLRLGENRDADQYQYAWFCPWETIISIQLNRKKDGNTVMIAEGKATVVYQQLDNPDTPISPALQHRIFGGIDKFIIELSNDAATNVQTALDAVRSNMDAPSSTGPENARNCQTMQ